MTTIKFPTHGHYEDINIDMTAIMRFFLSSNPSDYRKKTVINFMSKGDNLSVVENIWAVINTGESLFDFAKKYEKEE